MKPFPLFQDITLDLEAVEGGYSIEFLNGDEEPLYKEERPGAPWASTQIRAQLGNKLVENLPENIDLPGEWVKDKVEDALLDLDQDLEEDEDLRDQLQSPTVRKVLDATETVDVYPGEPTRYLITVDGRDLEFTPSDLNGGPGILKNAWLNQFPTDRLILSQEDWDKIAETWLENAEVHEEETATEDALLVENLLIYLRTHVQVFDSREVLLEEHHAWYDGAGEYVEGAAFVRSSDIQKFLEGEGTTGKIGKLSQELRRQELLKAPSTKIWVGGSEQNVRAWGFSLESLNYTEEAVATPGEEAERVDI